MGLVGACAPPGGDDKGDSTSSAGGKGVPAGSDAAAYKEALKDEKTITLNLGGYTTGPDHPSAKAYVAWAEYVTEMSGGKITFKHDFAGAKVSVDKMADGLGQGRMDMGLYAPTYQAEEFPVTNAFAGISTSEYPEPVAGVLTTFAARAEFARIFEPLQEETEEHGILGLYPLYAVGGSVKMHCNTDKAPQTLGDLKGLRVRISSPVHKGLAESLGMVPVSLTNPELYAALQRGVADCSISGVSAVTGNGYDEVTSSWTFGYGPGHDWVQSPIAWGISQKAWQKLPLAAQQLLWDSQPKFIELQLRNALVGFRQTIEATKDKGFDFGEYAPDTVATMEKYHAEERERAGKQLEKLGAAEDGQAAVDQYRELNEKWWKVVTEEFDFPADDKWADLPGDYSADMSEIDLKPFLDRFYKEVLAKGRPS